MVERLLKHVKLISVVLAACALFPMVSAYLPANGDLSMAVGRLGLSGRPEFMAPVWGAIVRWSVAHLSGSIAFRLGIVSAFFGVLCVALLSFTVERFLSLAAQKAEKRATLGECTYWVPVYLGTLLAALALLCSPSFFLGATRTSPLTVQLAIPFASFAAIGVMSTVSTKRFSGYLTALVGFLAALGVFEGAPGIIAFPILFVLVMQGFVRGKQRIANVAGLFLLGTIGGGSFVFGNVLFVRQAIRFWSAFVRTLPGGIVFPGCASFVAFVILPTAVLATLIATHRLKTAFMRRICLGIWALVVVALTTVTCVSRPNEFGRAADIFVEQGLGRLGAAKLIVSDGTWDDFILLKKPADVRLVSLRREHDPAYGQELLAWAKTELKANDDLRFAAELGPSKFLSEWFATDRGAATNCLFMTRTEHEEFGVQLVPDTYGWLAAQADRRTAETLAEEWSSAWAVFSPLLNRRDEPAAALLKQWFSIQGNSIGAIATAEDKFDLAWKACFRSATEVFPGNLSALLNLGSLLERKHQPPSSEKLFVQNRLKLRLNALRSLDEARWELSSGGRLFVDPKVREQIAQLREERRKAFETSPEHRLFATATDEMRKLSDLTGEAKQKELKRMESTTIAAVRTAQVVPWVKNLLLGDFSLQKGDPESLASARKAFQSIILEGDGGCQLAFGRLLDLDWMKKDKQNLEYDALLVLRKDIRHPQANAFLGMIRLEDGDYESAVRFLQRALKVTDGQQASAVKNDLALAMSALGRHEEAEKIAREIVAEFPDNWNYRDSLARVLNESGKPNEASAAQQSAYDLAKEHDELNAYRSVRRAQSAKVTGLNQPRDRAK